jgi:hypothetical protein
MNNEQVCERDLQHAKAALTSIWLGAPLISDPDKIEDACTTLGARVLALGPEYRWILLERPDHTLLLKLLGILIPRVNSMLEAIPGATQRAKRYVRAAEDFFELNAANAVIQ